MSIKITGFEQLERQLKDLADRADALHGEHSIPVSELLSPSFLSRCSLFNSAQEMFEKSGFKIETKADFEAIPDHAWDEFIRGNTSFGSWAEMLKAASSTWTRNKLGLE